MNPDILEANQRASARALYESTPECSFLHVAQQLSLPVETVRGWAEEAKVAGSPWRMLHTWEAERRVGRKASEIEDIQATHEEARKEAAAVVAEAEAHVTVVDGENAALLKRHRQEWIGPRALVYQAMKLGNTGKVDAALAVSKLAKMSAEALTLVQAGERQAYGVKPGDEVPSVVIERGSK